MALLVVAETSFLPIVFGSRISLSPGAKITVFFDFLISLFTFKKTWVVFSLNAESLSMSALF